MCISAEQEESETEIEMGYESGGRSRKENLEERRRKKSLCSTITYIFNHVNGRHVIASLLLLKLKANHKFIVRQYGGKGTVNFMA